MKPSQANPSSSEVNQLRTWLTARGIPSAQAAFLVKTTRTRQANAQAIAAHLSMLPHAPQAVPQAVLRRPGRSQKPVTETKTPSPGQSQAAPRRGAAARAVPSAPLRPSTVAIPTPAASPAKKRAAGRAARQKNSTHTGTISKTKKQGK